MIDIVAFQPEEDPQQYGFTAWAHHATYRMLEGCGDAAEHRKRLQRGIHILMSPERGAKRDKLKQRTSGLDEALLADLKRKNIAVGFAVRDVITETDQKRQALRMGRMMQNVRLCRTYNVPMVLCTLASNTWELCAKEDLRSFGRILGMTGGEVNNALNFRPANKGITQVEEQAVSTKK